MALLTSNPTELENAFATWGHRALAIEFLSFAVGHVTAYLIFANHGPHPILVTGFVLALISGPIAAVFGIVGVCRDTTKWPGILAILLSPLTVLYAV